MKPIYLFLFLGSIIAANTANTNTKENNTSEWQVLFDGETLDGWEPKIRGRKLGENFKNTFRVKDGAIVVAYDEYIGSGYGEPTEGMIEATKLLARKEAILLDPVYSGKGFAGLIGLIKSKKFTKDDNVLFIHTGGAVSLFAYQWAF